MGDSQFETLLRSPYVWDSNTYIDFWMACRDDCQFDYYHGEEDDIDRLAATLVWITIPYPFVDPFDDPSEYPFVTGWGKMIPRNLNKPLRYNDREIRYDSYRTNSLSELLRLIRNNYVHGNEYISRKVNDRLRWYEETYYNGQSNWIFCNNKFVKFWTHTFPMLTPFLWKEFHRRFNELPPWQNTRVAFYSDRVLINPDINLNRIQFVNDLSSAVSNQLDNGGLYKRYRLTSLNQVWKLEFRKLNADLITRILQRSNKVAIDVSKYNLFYRAFDKLDLQIENFCWTCDSIYNNLCTIFIVNSYKDADAIITKLASWNFPTYTVIIFEKQNQNTNLDTLSDIASKLANAGGFEHHEYPVSFDDLSLDTWNAILSGQKHKIKVGINTFLFRKIFPDDALSKLNGDALNNFLHTQMIEVNPNAELSEEDTLNISNIPSEIANCFKESESKFNVIYGRPFVGKTAAVNYHSKDFTKPNVSLFVAKCQWEKRQNFLNVDGLINNFVRDNPLHSCIVKSLIKNDRHKADIIVDCDFPEKLLLNENADIVSEIEIFCTGIASHTSEKVRVFVVLRPHWASQIEGMDKIKYEMTEEVAISVIQNDSLYSDATKKDFYNDSKVKDLVKNNFELSPIYWNIILEHINNDYILLDGSPHVATIAKLIVDSYFRKTGVTEIENPILLILHAHKALQEYRDSGVEIGQPMENHFTKFEEDLREYFKLYNSDVINSLVDYGLLKIANDSELKFYDSKMQIYFFVWGTLAVKTFSNKGYLARREILGYMNDNFNYELIEIYKQLRKKFADQLIKIKFKVGNQFDEVLNYWIFVNSELCKNAVM